MRQYPRRSFRERLYSFMIDRNGDDALGRATMIVYLALFIINLFVGSYILFALAWLLFGWMIFRMFSRNLPARRRENAWYVRLQSRISGFFRLQKNKWRDRKTHVFRTCPRCKNTLRLPRAKGKHTVVCPCCRHRFDIKI